MAFFRLPILKSAVLCTAVLIALQGPVVAQTAPTQLPPDSIITPYTREVFRAMRAWVRQREAPARPGLPFKVPAIPSWSMHCTLGPNGMNCLRALIALQCPSTITVEVQGVTTTVEVNCTGPDSEGNCDCDFL